MWHYRFGNIAVLYFLDCGLALFFLTFHIIYLQRIINLILKKRQPQMKKTPLKIRPLQDCIDAFHKSPLYESKLQLKGQEARLKKIGRNKILFKDPSLPSLNPIRDKENQHPNFNHQLKKPQRTRGHPKNLSFDKEKLIDMQHKLSRVIVSQRDINESTKNENLRKLILKKQYFIREKKLLPERNCMSATNKKENGKDVFVPQGVRQMRRIVHLKRTRQAKQEQEQKQLPIFKQAQRIAQQARPFTSPKASKHPIRSASLEDFLNEWKCSRLQ